MKPSNKVVYSSCFGGFSLSEEALKMLSDLNVNVTDEYNVKYDICRHDPRLIEVVEKLGDAASGRHAALKIAEITGNQYIIEEYDGQESVLEPQHIKWITIG